MKLSPREIESLLLNQVGCVAQKRLARGVKLNHPEAVALIGSQIQEFIRDRKKDLSEIMNLGRTMLGHGACRRSHYISGPAKDNKAGKLADLVLWSPAFFGAKPEIIVKGGQIAWAQMGMPNASIPTPEPIKTRKMFGAYGKAVGENSVIFVSKAAGEGIKAKYGINKRAVPVKNCRSLSKRDMVLNDFLPEITVNAENYEVHIEKDGKRELLTCQLTDSLLPNDTFFSN